MGNVRKNALAQTLIDMSGQQNVVIVSKAFVNFTGSIEAALLLGQLLYWTPKGKNGWVAKSDKELQDEICLTRYSVRQARNTLEEMGILETEIHRFNGAPTTHYKIKLDELEEKWSICFQNNRLSENKQIDCSYSDNSLSETEQTLTETTTEITRDYLTSEKNFEILELPEEIKEEMKTLEEHRQSTLQAMAKSFESTAKGIDLSSYPEDVRPAIEVVCELWRLRPPSKSSAKGDWIESARDLMDACGEFGVEAIKEYRKEFEGKMEENIRKGRQGVAPHTVSSPRSLINVCRSKAGEMRQAKEGGVFDDGMKTIVVPVGGVDTEMRVPSWYRVRSNGSIL